MSDGQALYLVLCVLYLSDCFVWIHHGITAFVSPWGGRWVTLTSSAALGDPGGRLVPGAILPGVSRLRTSQPPGPFILAAPVALEIDFANSGLADNAAIMPGAERAGRRVRFVATDMLQAYRAFRTLMALA